MWRAALPADDEAIVGMCLALYAEDPGPEPICPEQARRTLGALRELPARGRAIVAEEEGRIAGYALLMSYWSNELGGEVVVIDELYVEPSMRGRGLATELIGELEGATKLWPGAPVALTLEVTPANRRARALYERLGFAASNLKFRRRLRPARAR